MSAVLGADHTRPSTREGRDSFSRSVHNTTRESRGALVALDMAFPGLMAVSATGLDQPDVFAPDCEIWTSRARPWEPLLPGVTHFEEGFDNAWLRDRMRPRPLGS